MRVHGGVKIRIKPSRGCPVCILVIQPKKNGKQQGLIEAVQFFFMPMKNRDINPIGPLNVDHLKEHSLSLYDYLLKKKPK